MTAATLPRTGRAVLRRALDGLRSGEVEWGCEWFRNPRDDTSCLIGVLAWAADPGHGDRDPFLMAPGPARSAALEALRTVAAVLDGRGELPIWRDPDAGEFDPPEPLGDLGLLGIGEWSDDQPSALPVLEVLEAALERAS